MVNENGGASSALLVGAFVAALLLGLFLFGGEVFDFNGLNVNIEPPRIDRPASGAG